MSPTISTTIQKSNQILNKVTHDLFNGRSVLIFFSTLIVSWLIGRLVARALHKLSLMAGNHADRSSNLVTVKRYRRIETLLIIFTAIVKGGLIIIGLYVWWSLTHAGQQPTALIGASALSLLIISNLLSPVFRDLAFGGGMMAEQWFGVGDVVTIQPNDINGIVESVTLRSTKVRRLSGETVWISNQNISMVEVASKGTRPIALELFVSSVTKAESLIEKVNNLLPQGASLVASPLAIVKSEKNAPGVWHITALGETAPGRDYLLEKNAVDIIKVLDSNSEHSVLLAEPVARFADLKTERQFARALNNARKTKAPNRLRKMEQTKLKRNT